MPDFWDTYVEPKPQKEIEREEKWALTLTRNADGFCNHCSKYTDDLMFGGCPDC